MLVLISGGINAIIEPPFMIFKNKSRNYPIRNARYSVPGAAYRTEQQGWMNSINMLKWVCEDRVINPLPHGKIGHLFIDNCSGHNVTEENYTGAEKIRIMLVYFPPNRTDLVKPCDELVIQKIKSARRKR